MSEEQQTRDKKIFIAFIGPEISVDGIQEIADGYEIWNLKKISLDEFVKKVQERIPPVNKNVLKSYKVDVCNGGGWGVDENIYNECSWGLYIPETIREGYSSYGNVLGLLNLYAPKFLYPIFSVGDMGVQRHELPQLQPTYFHHQDGEVFNRKEFVSFYKVLLGQSKYAGWYLYDAKDWDKEDWRLFVAFQFFTNLKEYERGKSSFEWQRESLEISSLLESLFTAEGRPAPEITYRLKKRIAVVLSKYFPDIESDIGKLYGDRSKFVHGAFFADIAKQAKLEDGGPPVPDFKELHKHKEHARWALVAYLYLEGVNRQRRSDTNVIHWIESSIVDIEIRKDLLETVDKVLALMYKSPVL